MQELRNINEMLAKPFTNFVVYNSLSALGIALGFILFLIGGIVTVVASGSDGPSGGGVALIVVGFLLFGGSGVSRVCIANSLTATSQTLLNTINAHLAQKTYAEGICLQMVDSSYNTIHSTRYDERSRIQTTKHIKYTLEIVSHRSAITPSLPNANPMNMEPKVAALPASAPPAPAYLPPAYSRVVGQS